MIGKRNDVSSEEYSIDSNTTGDSSQLRVEPDSDAAALARNKNGSLEKNNKGTLERLLDAVLKMEESYELIREELRNLTTTVENLKNGQEIAPFGSFVTVEKRNSLSDITN